MILMGKGRTRAIEKGVIGQGTSVASPNATLNIPSGPVYYPTEKEFKDPLKFIYKIRPEAERYGICKIVPPKCWKPPFALNLDSFTFPTKTQAIHQLQARCAPCDPRTFSLEYNRFLEEHCGKKTKKKVVFEALELDLCKLFNVVKRFGGYDKVSKEKKWGEVFRFVRLGGKISECGKHVLCQMYREHLYDYEEYYNKLNEVKNKCVERGMCREGKREGEPAPSSSKRRRKSKEGERVEVHRVKEEEYDQICEQCQSGLHGEVMLLCDRCNKGWHIYCLSPPLKRVPPGNWYCLDCLNSEKDSFGFVPGKQLLLEDFRRVAERAKKKWFGSALTSRVQLEKKFWEIVEGSVGEVQVMYGSDLDTSLYGSGFPRVTDSRPPSVEINTWEEYCSSPWNLNNLPKLQGSVLRAVHQNITGVMVPWLYIGMLFSSFCWHVEDHCFYSMNYHHWGEPKCWYSVPGGEADAFEKVMRNSLPDLFDAQPDLLFQLVTMLNPHVLQENNVPVYSLLQEPGNFIITFPRSYHAGFNFGLNCAEAVNFAPADWLPHGGFGADLYKLYHKPAVLSHEELLCVVAKNGFDHEVSPYLTEELLRVYNKEKTWRERLWRNGVINSSPMLPRKKPESVGIEEDPTCVICKQFLYLSAITCQCRPSAFVCLEHWERLCECKTNKHSLLYRHTLSELNALVLVADSQRIEEVTRNSSKPDSPSKNPAALYKKVKGFHKTHMQLAEEWLVKSSTILLSPFRSDVYVNALKEAEEFLWAGPEMDPVHDMVKSLTAARDWAEAVRDCLFKVESWSPKHIPDMKKVSMESINRLLGFSCLPCNEPCHFKLKEYWLEARKLILEIDLALSKSSTVTVADLEALFSKTIDFPVHFKESEDLFHKLSSVKVWAENVKRCTMDRSCAMVEAAFLYKLEKEMLELQIQLPECELLSDLIMQVESCRSQCNEVLNGSMSLKKVEQVLAEFDSFNVNIVELKLLRQYHGEAVSWISRVSNVLMNIHEREDQENVVDELISIQRDGSLLKIQVEELPCIDIELKRASCRVKALKALHCDMSMNFLEELMQEAAKLQIAGEKLFADISGAYATAMAWERRAKELLESDAEMFEFEDVIRSSEDICVILPSLEEVKDAVSMATSWLNKSKPFLSRDLSMPTASSSLLEVEALKDLVLESKLLKISLRERPLLQKILKRCTEWEQDAFSLLYDAEWLLNIDKIGNGNCTDLISKIEHQLLSMESAVEAGLSLRLNFGVFPKFQDACSTLRWCLKALSFCAVTPTLEELEVFLEVAAGLQKRTYSSSALYISLVEATVWLKKSKEIAGCNRRFRLRDAEETLLQAQNNAVSFSLMVKQLQNSIEKHNLWLKEVHQFFSFNFRDRTWASLLQLRELGCVEAFNSSELDMVLSEVQKIEQWKRCCQDMIRTSAGNVDLLICLSEFKSNLCRSSYMLEQSKRHEASTSCAFCSIELEDQKLSTCSICKDCFHLQCIAPSLAVAADSTSYTCTYCTFINNGKVIGSGFGRLSNRQAWLELSKLTELLTDAKDLCLWIEEITILDQIVEKAHECQACLREIVDFVLAYVDKDLSIVTRNLSVALKAVELGGVCYSQGDCKLDLALARNSWKVRAKKLLEGSHKPTIQQIQRHLKEGLAIGIPLQDYYLRTVTEVRNIGMQWADTAKKVSADGGALGLDEVFELITKGENLPVYIEKELKLLRERSMLYCICRRPYDQRPMVACDKCDEWYHFDCVNLSSPPKVYICPACDLETDDYPCSTMTIQERSMHCKFVEPQTPSPRCSEYRRKTSKPKSSTKRKIMVAMDVDVLRRSSGIAELLWRNRKPFRRVVRKRLELGCLSPVLSVRNS